MPCDTIQTVSVHLGKVDEVLLAEAIKELGLTGQITYNKLNGELTVRGRNLNADQIALVKRQYSKQVVMSQAKKYGWQVKSVGEYKWEVIRR